MSKDSRRRYYERAGFIKPKDNSTFSRSEDGKRYQYDNRIANMFTKWSSDRRDKGIMPMFGDFYSELKQEDREQIAVTEIFKNIQS